MYINCEIELEGIKIPKNIASFDKQGGLVFSINNLGEGDEGFSIYIKQGFANYNSDKAITLWFHKEDIFKLIDALTIIKDRLDLCSDSINRQLGN